VVVVWYHSDEMRKGKLVRAKVIPGAGRGQKIGVPTLNLVIPQNFGLEPGVYACWARFYFGSTKRPSAAMIGVVHYGPTPVFDEDQYSLEVHLIDQKGPFYPEEIELKIERFIRSIRSFPDIPSLVAQIEQDVKRTRQALRGF
jgi:riboflavin kinase/FMN adenylyltransferase